MELVIDRGVKSYDVKDADGTLLGVIKINPADIGISGRFVSARKAIAELAEQAKTPFLFLKFERKSRYFFFILKSKSFQFFCKATAAAAAPSQRGKRIRSTFRPVCKGKCKCSRYVLQNCGYFCK